MTATIDSPQSAPGPDDPDPAAALLAREEAEREAGAAATLESEHSPKPKHDLPSLEPFRGIACIGVVITHVAFTSGDSQIGPWAGWLSRLDFGVSVFFVLSAFLLFRPYVQAAYGRRPPVETRSYLRRRVVRVWPALIVVLIANYLITPQARDASAGLWIQTLFLVQNYPNSFVNQIAGLVQTWSLVVEVAFYAFLPIIAWLILGRGTTMATASARAAAAAAAAKVPATPVTSRRAARERRRTPLRQRVLGSPDVRADLAARRPVIVIVLLVAVAIAWRWYYFQSSGGVAHQLLWLPPFLDWFSVGLLFAWLRERDAPVPMALRYVAQYPGVCWSIALAGYWLTTAQQLAGPYGLAGPTVGQAMFKHITYTLLAALLLLPACFGDPAAHWRAVAGNRFYTWLGEISFGVFLWHPMLMALVRRVMQMPEIGGGFFLTAVLTIVLSCLVGTISYRYLELPLQKRWRDGFDLPFEFRSFRFRRRPPESLRDLATG